MNLFFLQHLSKNFSQKKKKSCSLKKNSSPNGGWQPPFGVKCAPFQPHWLPGRCGKSIHIKLVLVSALGQTNGVIYARSQSYRRSDSEQRRFQTCGQKISGQKWPPNKKQKEWDKFRRNIEKKVKGIWLFWCWQGYPPLMLQQMWCLPKKQWPKKYSHWCPHRGILPRFTAVSDALWVGQNSWSQSVTAFPFASRSHPRLHGI